MTSQALSDLETGDYTFTIHHSSPLQMSVCKIVYFVKLKGIILCGEKKRCLCSFILDRWVWSVAVFQNGTFDIFCEDSEGLKSFCEHLSSFHAGHNWEHRGQWVWSPPSRILWSSNRDYRCQVGVYLRGPQVFRERRTEVPFLSGGCNGTGRRRAG